MSPSSQEARTMDLVGTPTRIVIDGKAMWRWPDGKMLPVVAGGDGPLATAVSDRELEDLRAEIKDLEKRAGDKKADADAKRDKLREDGQNPWTADDAAFDEFDKMYRDADDLRDQALVRRQRLNRALELRANESGSPVKGDGNPLSRSERREFVDISKRYLESEPYQRLKSSGVLESAGHFSSDNFELMSRAELRSGLRQRTTVNVGDAGGVVPIDQQVWPPIVIPVRQVRLLDLISIVTTDSDQVNFVQQSVRADVAAETPYGTTAPEADYEFALKSATVKRIPQFVPATKDILADQGQLQGLLEDQLMFGVRLGVEQRFYNGAGANFSDVIFQGILNTAGIGTVTARDGGHATEYDLDAVHRAITTIRLTLFADPTAVGLHPTTYENVLLQKDAYGRYIYPPGQEINTIWGLQPVITPLFTLGNGLVGDYKQGARMWLRTGLSVSASTEHADFFTRGMVAILAEMRAAFATIQTRAFCQVSNL